MRPSFTSSKQDSPPVSCIFDPGHMTRLVRNTLVDLKVLKNSLGQEIKWKFFEDLQAMADGEGSAVTAQIDWKSLKKLISEPGPSLLSRSVANAIRICRVDLKLDKFKDSEATEEFVRYRIAPTVPYYLFTF
jgi:hypothetical protein